MCMRTLCGEGALAPAEHGLPEPHMVPLPTVPLISGTPLTSLEPLHVPPTGPWAPEALSVPAVQAPSVRERASPCPPPLPSNLPSLVRFLVLH